MPLAAAYVCSSPAGTSTKASLWPVAYYPLSAQYWSEICLGRGWNGTPMVACPLACPLAKREACLPGLACLLGLAWPRLASRPVVNVGRLRLVEAVGGHRISGQWPRLASRPVANCWPAKVGGGCWWTLHRWPKLAGQGWRAWHRSVAKVGVRPPCAGQGWFAGIAARVLCTADLVPVAAQDENNIGAGKLFESQSSSK